MAKTIKKSGRFTLPANLSFRRSIEISDGLMSSVMPDGSLRPVTVEQVTVRGAMGNSTAGYNNNGTPLDGDALAKAQNPKTPNIQSIDRATLAPASDLLDVAFSVAFHSGGGGPDTCSKAEYRDAFIGFRKAAAAASLYEQLAARYLWNLINGRMLWRNGYGISAGARLVVDGSQTLEFDWGLLRERRAYPGIERLAAAFKGKDGLAAVNNLVAEISKALRGDRELLAIDVSLRVQSYKGAEVWPSQEFVEDSQKKRGTREISRVLASRSTSLGGERVRQGVMHSQKLGNALRTIDEWHGDTSFGAVPVEAFGWIQSELAAIRAPANQGVDAYRALESVGLTAAALEAGDKDVEGDALYTLAIVIRGGVWGISEKEAA